MQTKMGGLEGRHVLVMSCCGGSISIPTNLRHVSYFSLFIVVAFWHSILGGEYVLIVFLYNYVNFGRIYGDLSKQMVASVWNMLCNYGSLVFYCLSKGEKRVLFYGPPSGRACDKCTTQSLFLFFFQNGLKYAFFQFSSRQISTVYKCYGWISMLGSSM